MTTSGANYAYTRADAYQLTQYNTRPTCTSAHAGTSTHVLVTLHDELRTTYTCDAPSVVTVVVDAGPAETTYARGVTVTVVDASSAEEVAEYQHSPFGQTLIETGDAANDSLYRFSAKYLNEPTGYYYYGHRYYNAELGRWMNRDPIGGEGIRGQSLADPYFSLKQPRGSHRAA